MAVDHVSENQQLCCIVLYCMLLWLWPESVILVLTKRKRTQAGEENGRDGSLRTQPTQAALNRELPMEMS